jgi:hypothetical protein
MVAASFLGGVGVISACRRHDRYGYPGGIQDYAEANMRTSSRQRSAYGRQDEYLLSARDGV